MIDEFDDHAIDQHVVVNTGGDGLCEEFDVQHVTVPQVQVSPNEVKHYQLGYSNMQKTVVIARSRYADELADYEESRSYYEKMKAAIQSTYQGSPLTVSELEELANARQWMDDDKAEMDEARATLDKNDEALVYLTQKMRHLGIPFPPEND